MISKFKIGFQSWFLRSNIFFVSFGGSFGKTDLGPFGVLEKLTQDLLLRFDRDLLGFARKRKVDFNDRH